ncbi:MAG: hypothetical protein P4M11_13265 [Candidatus Pacebacteria bacterium]|nr:hypothetical protein [Candidatus Paceibacterota bacterium]
MCLLHFFSLKQYIVDEIAVVVVVLAGTKHVGHEAGESSLVVVDGGEGGLPMDLC